MDPEGIHDDVAIWQSLEIAQLKSVILKQPQVLGEIHTYNSSMVFIHDLGIKCSINTKKTMSLPAVLLYM